jgi:ribose/xylose/arabinose/galactoside ABC-type transport system permease subunit
MATDNLSVTVSSEQETTKKRRINWENYGLVAILIIELIIFSLLSPYFLGVNNLLNVGRAVSIQGITAAGMTIALISGGFDLSIASTVAASGVFTASLLQSGLPLPIAILGGVALGCVVGMVNGLLITKLRINPLIATLGMLSVVRGIAFLGTGGVSLTVQNEAFRFLGRGYLFGVPFPFVFMLILYAVVFVVLGYTQFGRYVYAIGGNPVATRLAGINVNKWRLVIYIIVGASAGLSGVFLSSQMGTAMPNAALGFELSVIAAVILGGASLAGGSGSIVGTLVAMFILGILNNGMVLLNVPTYYQLIAQGAILLIAVALDQFRTGGYK